MKKTGSMTALIYASMAADLTDIARQNGYALAVHGSMTRDFDLIAVPWTENAKPSNELIKAIAEGLRCYNGGASSGPEMKPHGRKAWVIPICCGYALDISVTARFLSAHPLKPPNGKTP